jgi:hypothetical protein
MKHRFPCAAGVARWIEHAVRAARFRGKMGKAKISTEAFALILAHPGAPIFRETTPARARCRFFAISPQMNLHWLKNQESMPTQVEVPTTARGCVRVNRRTRAALENSYTAVQHLTKTLFLSKPVEPPLIEVAALPSYADPRSTLAPSPRRAHSAWRIAPTVA